METSLYPLMSLRDIVIFPHMVAPLVVGRTKSIHALEDAMEKRTEILLVAQQDSKVDDPDENEIYRVGTLAVVMQLLRLPDGTIKALVEGKRKAEVVSFVPHKKFMQAEVRFREDSEDNIQEVEVYVRKLRKQFEAYADANRKIPREVVKSVKKIEESGKLVDVISAHLPIQAKEKQVILEIDSVPGRIEKVLEAINRELELAELEKDINARVKKRMGKTQRNYFLGEKVKVIQNEIGQNEDGVDEIGELEQSLKKKALPAIVRDKAEKELKKLRNMPPMSAETTVVRNYVDCILTLPWKKKTRAKLNIDKAENILNEDHYGLEKPKERILEYLAVQAQVKKLQGPILCLVGPPGVGKTSISRSIARAMGRKFTRISLGGVRDEAEIRGHRRTYVGAMPGKIIQAM
ncbi:MAG: AAA family ATPase, partial [Desulfobulbaceae bacterium]|nr:AAA family ATPase [Desulfobulbaceae bacterium]